MNLTEARARIAALLMDPSGLAWDDSTLDACLRQALDEFSRIHPRRCEALLPLPPGCGPGVFAGSIDLSELDGLLDVIAVTAPQPPVDDPRPLCRFQLVLEGGAPRLNLWDLPVGPLASGRVVYTAGYTLAGLDGATETILLNAHCDLLVLGAAGYAYRQRALMFFARPDGTGAGASNLMSAGKDMLACYHAQLQQLATRDWVTAHWGLELA